MFESGIEGQIDSISHVSWWGISVFELILSDKWIIAILS